MNKFISTKTDTYVVNNYLAEYINDKYPSVRDAQVEVLDSPLSFETVFRLDATINGERLHSYYKLSQVSVLRCGDKKVAYQQAVDRLVGSLNDPGVWVMKKLLNN